MKYMDKDEKRAALRDKKVWGTQRGYETWLKTTGREFQSTGNGKARWLGKTHVSSLSYACLG
jgi:hypothetical protein